MGSHTESPVRSALRESILNTITDSESPMTVADITAALGDEDAREIARLCYELRTKVHAQGKDMKTYRAMAVDSAEAWAARTAASMAVANAQPKKAKKTIVKPASWAHPWKQPAVTPKTAKAPRVTRPLPSHLQSVAPPPVAIEEPLIATTPVVTHEPPLDAPQTDLDAALIDALKHVLPAMQRAAADLPKSIETTTEEAPMAEDPPPYVVDPYDFTMTQKSDEEKAPAHECQGHCSNHAKEQEANEALLAALQRDDEFNKLEEIRLNLVDSLLIYANWTLRDDPVWKAMLRPYAVAAGSSLEVCHG